MFVYPVVLLGSQGVRVNTPFINAFQKKKAWNLPKSSTNIGNFKTCFFPFQNVASQNSFFFFLLEMWWFSFFFGNFPKCLLHHVCFHWGLFGGAPVMLLRNLNPLTRLCNGTCLIVRCFTMWVVEAEIITSKGASNVAFIPRIKFIFNNSGLPFTFAKKQFLLQLAYAMTINKSQG